MAFKVLVISNYKSTTSSRPEAEIFIGLHKLGIEITVMTYGQSEYAEKFRKSGIKVIDFHPGKKIDRNAIRFIRKELIEGGYQYLHLFNSKAIINGLIAARKLPVKTILYRGYVGNIHWYDPFIYLKYLNPGVDMIICNSRAVEESITSQFVFTRVNTITIFKGHAPEWYKDVVKKDLSELGIPDDAFAITNVCNVRPMKGIPDLIKATNLIPPELPVHFLLIGRGMDSKPITQLISKSINKNKIHILGYRNDSINIVASSHVFILPSVKGESMTKSVKEAMSLGVPSIITDIPGNTGLVTDNDNGLIVPAHNPVLLAKAIIRLFQMKDSLSAMGEKARRHIERNFNNQDTVLRYKQLYEDMSKPRFN